MIEKSRSLTTEQVRSLASELRPGHESVTVSVVNQPSKFDHLGANRDVRS
jgi:hypothetical protein